jgi:hypothetical protein
MSSWEKRMRNAPVQKRSVARREGVSPGRYTLAVGTATCLYAWLLGAFFAEQTGSLGVILGLSVAATVYRRAKLVPAVPRTGFRDYMPANLMVAMVWVTLLLCALYTGSGAERG